MPGDQSLADTDQEIRRLIVREGLTVSEAAERLGMPEPVIDAWLEQQNDVEVVEDSEAADDEAEFSEEAADGIGEHWSDAAVYRCSACKDVVAQENVDAHEEQCLRGADWSQLS